MTEDRASSPDAGIHAIPAEFKLPRVSDNNNNGPTKPRSIPPQLIVGLQQAHEMENTPSFCPFLALCLFFAHDEHPPEAPFGTGTGIRLVSSTNAVRRVTQTPPT